MEKDRLYYSISEVAEMFDVNQSLLRYWEKELHLNIPRNEFGYRYYLDKHIELFMQIHEMKEGGFQLKAIKTLISPDFLFEEEEKALVHTAYSAVGCGIATREKPMLSAMRTNQQMDGQDIKAVSKLIIMSKNGNKFEVIKGKEEEKVAEDTKDLSHSKMAEALDKHSKVAEDTLLQGIQTQKTAVDLSSIEVEIPNLVELNIGHSIIARAILVGLETAVKEMMELIK